MQRRKFSREYKLETVKLVTERGVVAAKPKSGAEELSRPCRPDDPVSVFDLNPSGR
jgi:hypothetical protein